MSSVHSNTPIALRKAYHRLAKLTRTWLGYRSLWSASVQGENDGVARWPQGSATRGYPQATFPFGKERLAFPGLRQSNRSLGSRTGLVMEKDVRYAIWKLSMG